MNLFVGLDVNSETLEVCFLGNKSHLGILTNSFH